MNKESPEETKKAIFKALVNPKYQWRTIEGISKETGIEPDIIQRVIRKYSDEVVKSALMSKSGKSLFTSRSKFRKEASILKKIHGAIKSRVE